MRKLATIVLCIALTVGLLPDASVAASQFMADEGVRISTENDSFGTTEINSLVQEIAQEESGKEYSESGIYSKSWYEIPNDSSGVGSRAWREGMITGNGENGVITSGAPYRDTMIFQYLYFCFPTPQPLATQPTYLEEARQAAFELNAHPNAPARTATFSYPFHPGGQLSLQMDKQGTVSDYTRWTNYETAETGVTFTDENGTWERRTFTSRQDNVTITAIHASSKGEPVNMTVSVDDISNMCKASNGVSEISGLRYKKLAADDGSYIGEVVKYPSYANSDLKYGGYATMTYVVAEGGTKEKILLGESDTALNIGQDNNPAIKITDADVVYLITKSNRDKNMCSFRNFANRKQYDLTERLIEETKAVADAREYKNSDGTFSYQKALAPHARLHGDEFNAAKFTLDGDEDDKSLPTEELLEKQRNDKSYINHALLERAWYAGRYAQLCASGIGTYRLCGMWSGEFNGAWRYDFTLDANVNLQVAAMNTNNMSYGILGYITFLLKQGNDFLTNAECTHGMHDAIQLPVHADGDHALIAEDFGNGAYPFEYWNAGASWCLLPVYEYWQCNGNRQIPVSDLVDYYKLKSLLSMKDEDGDGYYEELTDEEISQMLAKGYLDLEEEILLPLLTKQANYWEQLVTPEYYMDKNGKACHTEGKTSLEDGEKYMLIPTYSPENHPQGYDSYVTVNATMDISAARDGLNMAIAMEQAVQRNGYEKAVEKWENLLALLPDYKYDNTPSGEGALREWALEEYTENNNHRHISHLYAAWPAYETKEDEELKKGTIQSLINRDRYNSGDATTGHGWVHRALVYARVEDGEGALNSLKPLITNNVFYNSMMTDHNYDRGSDAYCTDTSMGLVATVNEMVQFSNTGKIQLCPAVPSDWNSGSMDGLMARTRAEIEKLSWNIQKGTVSAQIRSDIDQTIELTSKLPWKEAEISGTEAQVESGEYIMLTMKAGDVAKIEFFNNTAEKSVLDAAIQTAERELNSHRETDSDYVADAHTEYADAIAQAKAVSADASVDASVIRRALTSLEAAREDFNAAYDSSLFLKLAEGIYTTRTYYDVSYSGSDKLEIRYTTDGSEPAANSPVFSGRQELPEGISEVKAALFIKGSHVKIGETVSGRYLYLPGKNLALHKNVTTSHKDYGKQMNQEKAVDGDKTTRWAIMGDSDAYEMEIDLGADTMINSVYVDEFTEKADKEKSRIQSFELYYYQNGEYQLAYSFSEDNRKDMELVVYDTMLSSHAKYGACFDEVITDKVRLVFRASKEISLWEVQLFDVKKEKEPPKQVSIQGKTNYNKTYGDGKFKLDVSCGKGTDGRLTYTSSNPSVAKVSSDGVVGIQSAGTAVVTVNLVSETCTAKAYKVNIKVKPSKVVLSSVKSKKKKQAAVSWKKLSSKQKITGYQIVYSMKKNFASKKTVYVKKTASVKTIKKLKAKKKYYFRIRAYKTVGKSKLYGAWSRKISAKIK